MERPFDHLNRDCENKKNSKKSSTKKRWLLSRQYLQKLDEHEDDVSKDQISDPSVKNRLRCICRSAFYGMKEGLLTGIFVGGIYGIFKLLSRSSSAFYDSTGGGRRRNENETVSDRSQKGGVSHERKSPARNRRADMRTYHSTGRRQSGSRNSSVSYQEKLSSYKTIEQAIYGCTTETKTQNFFPASRTRNIDLHYSKLPVRTVKYLKPLNSKVDDNKKYSIEKTSEKVEIVGYAFIKTMGAFEAESTSLKSIEYGSPKQSKTEMEKEEEEEEEEEDPPIEKSKSSVGSSKTFLDRQTSDSMKSSEKGSAREKSAKSLRGKDSVITENPEIPEYSEKSSKLLKSKESVITKKPEKSSLSIKNKESVLTPKHEKSAHSLKSGESVLTAKYDKSNISTKSGNASKISVHDKSIPPSKTGSDREPRDSKSKGLIKAISSSLKGDSSKGRSRQTIINEGEEQKQKPSRITIVSPKYHSQDSRGSSTDQSSSVLIKSLEPDQSEISTRPTNDLSQDSRLRSKDSSKTSKGHSKHSVRSSVIIESDPDSADASLESSKTTIKSKPSDRFKKSFTGSKTEVDENLYPRGRAPSYLVNADDISNGYGSPTSNQEQQSEHETIHSKFSEEYFSPEVLSSKADFDEVGLTGSNISEFQIKSPFRGFSPSISASLADQNKTPKNSIWSLNAIRDSSSTHLKEASISQLKNESNITLKTPKQSRSVIFTDSRRDASETARPDMSELLKEEHSEKVFLSHERVSDENHSERLHHSSEHPSARSGIPSEQYIQKSRAESRETSKTSYRGGLAKSNSSLIQDVGPDSSRSSVSKAAAAASRTQKTSPEQEESTGLSIFSSVSDNTILLCACNCALVLGIICTVISSTRASLRI